MSEIAVENVFNIHDEQFQEIELNNDNQTVVQWNDIDDPKSLPHRPIIPRKFETKLSEGLTLFEIFQEFVDEEFFRSIAAPGIWYSFQKIN